MLSQFSYPPPISLSSLTLQFLCCSSEPLFYLTLAAKVLTLVKSRNTVWNCFLLPNYCNKLFILSYECNWYHLDLGTKVQILDEASCIWIQTRFTLLKNWPFGTFCSWQRGWVNAYIFICLPVKYLFINMQIHIHVCQ